MWNYADEIDIVRRAGNAVRMKDREATEAAQFDWFVEHLLKFVEEGPPRRSA